MKPNRTISLLALAACLCWQTLAQQTSTNAPPAAGPTNGVTAVAETTSANDPPMAMSADQTTNSTVPAQVVSFETDKGLRFNFRGAPLEMVLNYLSDAAGFIIVLEADAKGKVDLWSNQPLTKDEAVTLLNATLEKNGLTAIRNERTLTIIKNEDARKRDIPVKSGSEPNDIPKTDNVVTQILPVHALKAVQLAKDLEPLLPSGATITANEAGNALVMTDTQAHVRRVAEIIKALDNSSVLTIRVFPLKFADAKTVANMIKEVFPSANASQSGDRGGFFGRFGGFGGDEHRHGDQSSTSSSAGASRVMASADDNSNSVVVSAADELMPTIQALVESVDKPGEDVTELRVFPLKYADPQEMADLLSNLFPDDTKRDDNNRSMGFRFGGFPFGPSGMSSSSSSSRSSNSSSNESDRMKKKGRVLAVADRRTASVVVSADRDLMSQIAVMIEQLDANPAKKQKVFVYSLENADVQDVEQILQNLFQSENNRNTATSRNNQQNNPLTTRNNNQNGTTTGFGQNSSFGNNQQFR